TEYARGVRSALAVVALAAVVSCASVATAAVRDDSILNETQFYDATSDATGGGADLSSLTVTTYTDGTVSFAVQFANRDFLHPGETAQIFIDLNDDKTDDLNLSIWPTGDPSYLDHWGRIRLGRRSAAAGARRDEGWILGEARSQRPSGSGGHAGRVFDRRPRRNLDGRGYDDEQVSGHP
ncbi:MAG: hypothetical protein ACXVQ0_12845, partial [Actinomycetota bacterium]